jgi:hypothetical protein
VVIDIGGSSGCVADGIAQDAEALDCDCSLIAGRHGGLIWRTRLVPVMRTEPRRTGFEPVNPGDDLARVRLMRAVEVDASKSGTPSASSMGNSTSCGGFQSSGTASAGPIAHGPSKTFALGENPFYFDQRVDIGDARAGLFNERVAAASVGDAGAPDLMCVLRLCLLGLDTG